VQLDVCAVERPERSSSGGQVSVSEPTSVAGQHIAIVRYPYSITDTELRNRCARNEFKRHTYRSHLIPAVEGTYASLVQDNSIGESPRRLVVASRRSGTSDRVVLSSMALDWAWHEKLLCNIIVYITEGLPRVAFVSHGHSKRGDFEYLVSSAALSKIPHEVYVDSDAVPSDMLGIHGIYVIAPEAPAFSAAALWKRVLAAQTEGTSPSRYRRMYQLREEDGALGLVQHSSHSSMDTDTDRALSWLDRRYAHAMWGGSFWNTYEVVAAMMTVGLDMNSYLPGILGDMEKHYESGSYDGVVGATCGLLDLCVALTDQHSIAMETLGFGRDRLIKIADWLVKAYPDESPQVRQTCALTLAKAAHVFQSGNYPWRNTDNVRDLLDNQRRDINALTSGVDRGAIGELDAVRMLRLGVLIGASVSSLNGLFQKLQALQRSDGSWGSTVRTAHVIDALLDSHDVLGKAVADDAELNGAIYSGVLHLRSTFNERQGNWSDDIQSTAKAIGTLAKHNKRFAYSTQDFHDVIRRGTADYERGAELAEMRADLAFLRMHAARSQGALEAARRETREVTSNLEALDTAAQLQKVTTRRLRAVSTVSTMLLAGVLLSLIVNQREALFKLVSEIGSLLPLIIGAIIALPLTRALSKEESSLSSKE
jgi:hypothetical protein